MMRCRSPGAPADLAGSHWLALPSGSTPPARSVGRVLALVPQRTARSSLPRKLTYSFAIGWKKSRTIPRHGLSSKNRSGRIGHYGGEQILPRSCRRRPAGACATNTPPWTPGASGPEPASRSSRAGNHAEVPRRGLRRQPRSNRPHQSADGPELPLEMGKGAGRAWPASNYRRDNRPSSLLAR